MIRLSTEEATLNLRRNQIVRLSRARDARLRVVDGLAWITIDGQARDIVLERGGSLVVDSNEDVLVFALQGPAAVEVAAPA
ncbi:MAG TPA: DUF2917 domain-containing protein [Albitalea sp.]